MSFQAPVFCCSGWRLPVTALAPECRWPLPLLLPGVLAPSHRYPGLQLPAEPKMVECRQEYLRSRPGRQFGTGTVVFQRLQNLLEVKNSIFQMLKLRESLGAGMSPPPDAGCPHWDVPQSSQVVPQHRRAGISLGPFCLGLCRVSPDRRRLA